MTWRGTRSYKMQPLCITNKPFNLKLCHYSIACMDAAYWMSCVDKTDNSDFQTCKNNMKWKAEPPLCVIFDAQLNCRVSTLVTQTSGSVYWPQVLVINIHDAGACALPISECLSFPDLSVKTFKVDVFPALLFDLESPELYRQWDRRRAAACRRLFLRVGYFI